MGGLMSTTGWPDSPPTRTGTAMSDVVAGMSCAIGILAAYVNRLRTGVGDKVDVSLVDSIVSSLEIINVIYLCTGRVPERQGNRYESIAPYNSFRSSDGFVIIACGNDKLFQLLGGVMGTPEILEDERFSSNASRVLNHAELEPLIEKWTTTLTCDEIVDKLMAAGIPSCPIFSIDRVVNDPHIAGAREMFVEIDHPIVGKLRMTGNQIKLSNNKIDTFLPAPTLSQHTREVLKEKLGYSDEQVDALIEHKAV